MTKTIFAALIAGGLSMGLWIHPAAAGDRIVVAANDTLLDINSASKADLQALKGIGDKRADDIIKHRPYKGKDDLVSKKVIPQATYDGIKDKIIAKQK